MTLAKEFIKKQNDSLLSEKEKIESELSSIATKDKKLDGDFDVNFPDYGRTPDDNAMEEENYAARVGIEGSLELKLRDVNSALEKIKNGKYGICEKCEKEIEESRLDAIPSATLCMSCIK